MKTIYSRYDKTQISGLTAEEFTGRIFVVLNESEAEKAVDYLLSANLLGVDTETRPSFRRGERNKVALLQVSTEDTCFLFRLNRLGLCPAVVRLLEDTSVPKVGLSWHDDLRMLHGRGDFNAGFFVELQDMVGDIGIKDLSLQKVYANLFRKKISKRQRLTNWEADILTDLQKAYAALDAFACIRIFKEIESLKTSGEYALVDVPEPERPKPEPAAEGSEAKKEKEKKEKKSSRPRGKRRTKKPAAATAMRKKKKTEKPAEQQSQ